MPSCRPPLDLLLEFLPRLQPRYYSISSSPRASPGHVSVTAVVLRYESRIGRQVNGVATNYLSLKLPAGQEHPTVPIFVRKSQLRLPAQSRTPVIMIGPGTGFAPFRGFLQEREYLKSQGRELGPTVLFFGCRHKSEDYIYQEQLEKWHSEGIITELHVAFSRDQEKKVYVQHLLQQNRLKMWNLLKEGAHVYVCGYVEVILYK